MNTADFYQATGCSRTGGIPMESGLTLFFGNDYRGVGQLRFLIQDGRLVSDAHVDAVINEVIAQKRWPSGSRNVFVVMTKRFNLARFMDFVVPYLEFIEVHRSR